MTVAGKKARPELRLVAFLALGVLFIGGMARAVLLAWEETDLSFLDFGGTKRHPRGTKQRAIATSRKPPRATPRRGFRKLERETGIEPATLSLGRRKRREQ